MDCSLSSTSSGQSFFSSRRSSRWQWSKTWVCLGSAISICSISAAVCGRQDFSNSTLSRQIADHLDSNISDPSEKGLEMQMNVYCISLGKKPSHTGCIHDDQFHTSAVTSAALLATASLTANSFWRVDRFAGKLMIPYLVWLVLANLLNANIAMNNSSVSFGLFS